MDPIIVEAIAVSGIGGLSVRGVMALIKKKVILKKGLVTLFVSLIVCAVATALYLVPTGFVWTEFAAYTAFVFVSTNFIYRTTPKKMT